MSQARIDPSVSDGKGALIGYFDADADPHPMGPKAPTVASLRCSVYVGMFQMTFGQKDV